MIRNLSNTIDPPSNRIEWNRIDERRDKKSRAQWRANNNYFETVSSVVRCPPLSRRRQLREILVRSTPRSLERNEGSRRGEAPCQDDFVPNPPPFPSGITEHWSPIVSIGFSHRRFLPTPPCPPSYPCPRHPNNSSIQLDFCPTKIREVPGLASTREKVNVEISIRSPNFPVFSVFTEICRFRNLYKMGALIRASIAYDLH